MTGSLHPSELLDDDLVIGLQMRAIKGRHDREMTLDRLHSFFGRPSLAHGNPRNANRQPRFSFLLCAMRQLKRLRVKVLTLRYVRQFIKYRISPA